MLERVNKEHMLFCMLSGTINAIFSNEKCLELTSKKENLKFFLFSSFLFNYCHTIDRRCELEC